MKVDNFIEKYITSKNKDDIIKSIIKQNEYIPFARKAYLCNNIVMSCCYSNDGGNTKFKPNGVLKNYLLEIALLELYTNIEFDGKDKSEVYDKLRSSKALKPILLRIDKDEYEEIKEMLEITYSEKIDYERDLTRWLDTKYSLLGQFTENK